MRKSISSLQNAAVKKLIQLKEKSRERKKNNSFVIEGFREIQLALKSGYQLQEIWVCDSIFNTENASFLTDFEQKITIFDCSEEVYGKIAHRGSTEGIIAVAKAENHTLKDLHLPKNPLILIAEAPEKPGNIGALLRTADAAGVDAFILANPKTDLYNPNTIRSSVGAVFTVPIALASTLETIEFLKNKNIALYSAILQESVPYQQMDYTNPTAIAVGTEADGLTDLWRERCQQNISIPMQGTLDSMNVSVAAGILIFEARRQRGFH
ncbi:TrmH family RNA methyltransferase [Flavimarina sp. Hel_I_48]|uniref:TrmH family RNA methyltransferase n=1 Tax=Flavimarina sp. Hel_I_48 TaxID=1392488 RepID=UPI0004DF44B5|nr:RNA methyltransferase [Flavimarina sp. Hel_I_48]